MNKYFTYQIFNIKHNVEDSIWASIYNNRLEFFNKRVWFDKSKKYKSPN